MRFANQHFAQGPCVTADIYVIFVLMGIRNLNKYLDFEHY